MSTPKSLEKFLGIVDLSNSLGPLGLLGILPDQCDEATIVASLHARLARVSAHPQNRTPEADQVRLALHAAAAQLMDPVMREKVLRAARGESAADGSEPFDPLADDAAARPVAAAAESSTDHVDPALRRDTKVLLGAFGGLNPASHRRLTMLAQARGVSQDQMQRVLATLTPAATAGPLNDSGPSAATPPWPQSAGPTPFDQQPLQEQIDPGYLVLDRLIKFGLVFVVAMFLLGGAIYLLVRPSAPKPAPAPIVAKNGSETVGSGEKSTGLFSNGGSATKKDKPVTTPEPARLMDSIAALRKLASTSGTDAKTLMTQLDLIGQSWFDLAPDQSASLQDTVVEAMYRLAPEEGSMVIDALVSRAAWMKDSQAIPSESQVSDAVLACGLLTRLSKEESFPPALRRGIDSAIASVFEQAKRSDDRTFQSGAQASLYAAADRLSSKWADPAVSTTLVPAWNRWAKVAIASGGTNRHRVVLLTLEGLLTNAPDPTQSKGVFDAIGELTGSLDVLGDVEVKNWILRWLVAPGIDAEHLFALTSRLAENPAHSAGIDHTLVVPTSATERSRTELRERYAKVWGIGDLAEGDKVRSAWIAAAKREIAAPSMGNYTLDRLARLHNWEKLNDAASLLWSGNQKDASDTIDSVSPITTSIAPAPSTTPNPQTSGITTYTIDIPGGDGSFGARYFSIPPADRTKLVNDSFKTEEIGPRDAAIAVMEFIRTSSTSTKAALKELIRRRSHDRFMLRAMLDFSSMFPRSREVSDLVEAITGAKLPAPDESVWRIEMRRSLVESNLAQIARNREFGTLDIEAENLAAGYWQRLGVQSIAGLSPDRVAYRLTERWRQQARVLIPTGKEALTIDQIERKLVSRRAQARGIVQRFAAEQLGLIELLAYTIANESPARMAELRTLVDAAEKDVASQNTVVGQIEILERTMTRLWLIRFDDKEGVHPT